MQRGIFSILFLSFIALGLAGCGSGGSDKPFIFEPDVAPICQTHDDCPTGQVCAGGNCVAPGPAPSVNCFQAGCPKGQLCNPETNACEGKILLPDCTRDGCTSEFTCNPQTKQCEKVPLTVECSPDKPCTTGQECKDGKCEGTGGSGGSGGSSGTGGTGGAAGIGGSGGTAGGGVTTCSPACATDQTCNETTKQCENVPPPIECSADKPCAAGQECKEGKCQVIIPTKTCQDVTCGACETCDPNTLKCNLSCQSDEKCVEKQCVKKVCPPNGQCDCTDVSQCSSGDLCTAGKCTSPTCGTDCSLEGKVCNEDSKKCVECLGDTQCTQEGKKVCNTVAGSCVSCTTPNKGCSEGQVCDVTGENPACVVPKECQDEKCDAGKKCNSLGECVAQNTKCPDGCPPNQYCDESNPLPNQCVDCLTDFNCENGDVCSASGQCVKDTSCTKSSECGTTEVCKGGACIAGLKDAETTCQLKFIPSLALRGDAIDDKFDIPANCSEYFKADGTGTSPEYVHDLHCCKAKGKVQFPAIEMENDQQIPDKSGQNILTCADGADPKNQTVDKMAVTLWKPNFVGQNTAMPLTVTIKRDLTTNDIKECKISFKAAEFPHWKLENTGLQASLLISAGSQDDQLQGNKQHPLILNYQGHALNPDHMGPLNPGVDQAGTIQANCKVTSDPNGENLELAIADQPGEVGFQMRFFVALYNSQAKCNYQKSIGKVAQCDAPFSSLYLLPPGLPLAKDHDNTKMQVITGLEAPILNLVTGLAQQGGPGVEGVNTLSVLGEPLRFEAQKSRMRLVTAFKMPNSDAFSRCEESGYESLSPAQKALCDLKGTGQILAQLQAATMTASLEGEVTLNDGKKPVKNKNDILFCGGEVPGCTMDDQCGVGEQCGEDNKCAPAKEKECAVGKPCANGQICKGSKCEGCNQNGQCDANLGLTCQEGACKVKPSQCVPACEGGLICQAGVCGACTDNIQCNDENKCTDDACQAGKCVSTDAVVLAATACQVSTSCDPEKGIVAVNQPSGTPCDDGQFCNGQDKCDDQGSCLHESPSLDDGMACTVDSCDETLDTVVHTPDDTLCAAGEVCDGTNGCKLKQVIEYGFEVKSPSGEGQPFVALTADQTKTNFTGTACILGTVKQGGGCEFDPANLPYFKEANEPYANDPTVKTKFSKTGSFEIKNTGKTSVSLKIPDSAGSFKIACPPLNSVNGFMMTELVVPSDPPPSLNCQVTFSPDGPANTVSGNYENPLKLTDDPAYSVQLTLMSQAKQPKGVLEVREIDNLTGKEKEGTLLSGSEVDFGEAAVNTKPQSRAFSFRNIGVRDLTNLNVILGDDNKHNFRRSRFYMGQAISGIDKPTTQTKNFQIKPQGVLGWNDLYLFVNYGPHGKVDENGTREDVGTLGVSGISTIALKGIATSESKSAVALYIEDKTRHDLKKDSNLEIDGAHLYLATPVSDVSGDVLSFSLRQDPSEREVYLKNEGQASIKVKSLTIQMPGKIKFTKDAAVQGCFDAPPCNLEIKDGFSLKIGKIKLEADSTGNYEPQSLTLQVSTAPNKADGTDGTQTTVGYKIGGVSGAPHGLQDFIVHRLLAMLNYELLSEQNLTVSSMTRGIAERSGNPDFQDKLIIEGIVGKSGIELDAVKGTAKLYPIFTPVQGNQKLSTKEVQGLRLFNAPGSSGDVEASIPKPEGLTSNHVQFLPECIQAAEKNPKKPNPADLCSFFFIYIANEKATEKIPECKNLPAIFDSYEGKPIDPSNPVVLNPAVGSDATCMKDKAFTKPELVAEGDYDPVTGRLRFPNLVIRMLSPKTPIINNEPVDVTMKMTLTTDVISEQNMKPKANEEIKAQLEHPLLRYLEGNTNPFNQFVGSEYLQGRPMGLSPFKTMIDDLACEGLGDICYDKVVDPKLAAPLTFDLAGVSEMTSDNGDVDGKTMYLVISVGVQDAK